MKKRTLTIVAVLAAISMLSFVVFAGNDTYEGYERFKDLLRNEQNTEDYGQGSGSVIIIDNGEKVLTVSGEFAGNHETEEGYGNILIQSDEVDKSLEFYGQDQTMYVVDGNNVYTGTHEEENEYSNRRDFENKDEFDAKSEAVLDFLMGDFKDDFSVDGENIVFELTKEEMPALLNLMTSDDSGHRDEMKHEMTTEELAGYPLFEELKSLETVLPELTDTEIEYIKVVLVVENNTVTGVQTNVIVKGLDENNDSHVVEVQAEFNKTDAPLEIKTFELTDETVYEIKDRD